jgi:hypothetical protein
MPKSAREALHDLQIEKQKRDAEAPEAKTEETPAPKKPAAPKKPKAAGK